MRGVRELLMSSADRVEEADQLLDVARVKLAERHLLRPIERRIETVEKVESFRGDPAEHLPAITVAAEAADQKLCFEPVEQTCDAGSLFDHPVSDLEGWNSFFASSTQDAENVVLLERDAVRLDDLGEIAADEVGGAHERDRAFGEGCAERLVLLELFL